jgi:hypothetical protein
VSSYLIADNLPGDHQDDSFDANLSKAAPDDHPEDPCARHE